MDIRSALFVSLLTIGTAAHASGFYVLGSAGQADTSLKDVSKDELDGYLQYKSLLSGNDYTSKLDRSDTGYKAQVGYQFNENFAVEGGYTNLGEAKYTFTFANGSSSESGHLTYKSKGWNVDALATLPVNAGVSLFGKLGLIHAETKFSGGNLDSQKTTKNAPLFGAGVAWNFYRGLSARAEWERYFNLAVGGDLKTNINIDLYSVGLSYRF